MQTSDCLIRLKDGATAQVSVTVVVGLDATDRLRREEDLTNLLGGCLVGSLSRVLAGVTILEARSTAEVRSAGKRYGGSGEEG